jgi:hypothetical protein
MTGRVQGRQLKDQIPFGVRYRAGCQYNDLLYIHPSLKSKYPTFARDQFIMPEALHRRKSDDYPAAMSTPSDIRIITIAIGMP